MLDLKCRQRILRTGSLLSVSTTLINCKNGEGGINSPGKWNGVYQCTTGEVKWCFISALPGKWNGVLSVHYRGSEMVFYQCTTGEVKWCFISALPGKWNGVLSVHYRGSEMVFYQCTTGEVKWCFISALPGKWNGVLSVHYRGSEMVFFQCTTGEVKWCFISAPSRKKRKVLTSWSKQQLRPWRRISSMASPWDRTQQKGSDHLQASANDAAK